MRKRVLVVVVVLVAGAGAAFYVLQGMPQRDPADQSAGTGNQGAGQGRGSGGSGGFGGQGSSARAPMTVELGMVSRATISEQITVVGNLIAEATVAVVPRTAGRLQDISVKLGDRVTRGQRIAKVEDFELVEQVKQAEAAQEVALATIRQREADLKLAETNVGRSRDLFQRQLIARQILDDTEARYQSAIAQLDTARAQQSQSKARLDELQISVANTVITSPVDGFVAKRSVDPGAFVSQQMPVAEVVDITPVRLVANIVEKDLKQLHPGNATEAQVDAFPGESFRGRIARVSPVLDPTTRTAPIEIEIPNGDARLRPGMYARVGISTGQKKNALVVPSNALVDLGGRRGVFVPRNDTAVFRIVQVGLEQPTMAEVLGGLAENETVITTGSAALRDGDRILLSENTGETAGPRGRSGPVEAAAARGNGGRNGGTDTGRGAP
jgi:RND family efflux transporter MFP subunit